MTPTPPQPSMSAKIAASVKAEEEEQLRRMERDIRARRLAAIAAEGKIARGKSRIKAHKGELAIKKDRSVARRKAASRSRARNRK